MKSFLLFGFLLFTISNNSFAQNLYFPPISGNTWDTIHPSSLNWCPQKIDSLKNYLATKNTKAFILLKDGKIVLEEYFGTFTQDSLWYWASAGKTLTAFTVGIAQQEHHLSIQDTTSQYLGQGWTNCTTFEEEKISIRNQLTMTSGLDDGISDHYCTLDTCLNYLAPAGTRWAYHNGPYTLLDQVIQNAVGQSLNGYTNQKIKTPTGMTGLYIPVDYNNIYFSTARSMARFGLLMLNKGKWDNTTILSDTSYYQQMINTSQTLNKAYGYLWWLNGKSSFKMPSSQFTFSGSINPSAPNDLIMALGKNGQFINIVPSQNLVFIRMGNAPGVGEVPSLFNDTIWQHLNDLNCVINTTKEPNFNDSRLRIFPNPSQGYCTILCANQSFDYLILNHLGQVIKQQDHCYHQITLNLKQYPRGLYFIQIKTKDQSVFSQKLQLRNEK
jgi:CubicO group peptidase (beta-lactamase class C family)